MGFIHTWGSTNKSPTLNFILHSHVEKNLYITHILLRKKRVIQSNLSNKQSNCEDFQMKQWKTPHITLSKNLPSSPWGAVRGESQSRGQTGLGSKLPWPG